MVMLPIFYGILPSLHAEAAHPVSVRFARQVDQAALLKVYHSWKERYLKSSLKMPGDYKIAFQRSGSTVSEAMGYGMLITVMMADSDPKARSLFDGLNRFRKRYPSKINPAFMCWKIPSDESVVADDSATDGDMDMALALLMAHRQWGDPVYLSEAKKLITSLASSLVRPDFSLRLGDWDTDASEPMLTRPSDFMPANFRAFGMVSGDPIWGKLENRCYEILEEIQKNNAPSTGLLPDFAVDKNGHWQPAKPKTLEGPHDGDYGYNACRIPWRIGWAAIACDDARARKVLRPLMDWAKSSAGVPEDFKAGYHLDGRVLKGADFDSPCFIVPTGVSAMALGDDAWRDGAIAYAMKAHEGYYEDSVSLLSLLVMAGKGGLPGMH
jgi:endo-1,4-beta-D-glucanase Y